MPVAFGPDGLSRDLFQRDATIEVSGQAAAAALPPAAQLAAARAQPGGAPPGAVDHAMSAALAAMRASQRIEGTTGMVTLPEPACLPGDGAKRSKLYVRKCYHDLFEILIEQRTTLIIGTPGIGKSWFLLYVMWRLQQSPVRPVIVWEPRRSRGMRYLLKGGCAYRGTTTLDFEEELQSPDTWYLVDGQEPSQMSSPAHIVLASSPRTSTYKEYVKAAQPRKLVMPLWSPDELEGLYKGVYEEVLDRGRVQSLVDKYGPVPRYVLEAPAASRLPPAARDPLGSDLAELKQALAAMDLEQMVRSVSALEQVPESSHRLLHMEASNDFGLQHIKFASLFVGERIKEMYSDRSKQQVRSILDAMGDNSAWRLVKGVLFEQYSHQVLSEGGTFVVHELGAEGDADEGPSFSLKKGPSASDSWLLTLKPSDRITFGALVPAEAVPGVGGADAGSQVGAGPAVLSAAEIRAVRAVSLALTRLGEQPQGYLMPSSPTFPGVDSILLPRILFQVTVSPKREYPGPLIPALLNAVAAGSMGYLVFCVHNQPQFKVTGLPAGLAGEGRVRVLWLDLAKHRPAGEPSFGVQRAASIQAAGTGLGTGLGGAGPWDGSEAPGAPQPGNMHGPPSAMHRASRVKLPSQVPRPSQMVSKCAVPRCRRTFPACVTRSMALG